MSKSTNEVNIKDAIELNTVVKAWPRIISNTKKVKMPSNNNKELASTNANKVTRLI